MAQRRGKQRKPADAPEAEKSHASDTREPDEPAGPIPEMMRRALTLGLSGFFTTEGALRKALEDTVPKDWTDFIAETSERTRSEFLKRLSGEIGRVLEGVDVAAVLNELLLGRTLEIKAEFRLSDLPGDDQPEDSPPQDSPPQDKKTRSPTIRFSVPRSAKKKSGTAATDAEAQGDD